MAIQERNTEPGKVLCLVVPAGDKFPCSSCTTWAGFAAGRGEFQEKPQMESLTCSNKEILFPKHLCTQLMTLKVTCLLAKSLLIFKKNNTW